MAANSHGSLGCLRMVQDMQEHLHFQTILDCFKTRCGFSFPCQPTIYTRVRDMLCAEEWRDTRSTICIMSHRPRIKRRARGTHPKETYDTMDGFQSISRHLPWLDVLTVSYELGRLAAVNCSLRASRRLAAWADRIKGCKTDN